MQDSHRVWLTIGSLDISSGDAIGQLIGLESNARPVRNGAPPRKAFILQSDREISEHHPIDDHFKWLIGKTENQTTSIQDLLSKPGFFGSVLIQIVTDKFYGDFMMSNEFLAHLVRMGVDVEFSILSEAGEKDVESDS
ncbi:hypothetical protein L1787_04505 [Acuticoccus sp. M5D2P5]|uniref:hypothetical protein n=1 Tax=Acuticoccus kalidii TaxID=2910977 RepID=UPI001F25A2A5|nr:hypothetical protein [Acuticoccus kalidii]MCF3932677.1 hypothetical protein [Acuticoccus kalidii]